MGAFGDTPRRQVAPLMMGACLVTDVLWLQLAVSEMPQAIFTTALKPAVLECAVTPAMRFESPYCKQLL